MKKILLVLSVLACAAGVQAQDYIKDGDALFTAGKYEEAKVKYKARNSFQGETAHTTKRIEQCDECVKLLTIADYLWAEDDIEKACERYSEVLTINPADPTAKAKIADTKKSAEVEKVWVDHNHMEDGVKGMLIHIKFKVHNMLDKTGSCTAYFHLKDGAKLQDTNGSYKTKDGQVSTSKTFKPSYRKAVFNDLTMFMPNSELHCTGDKRWELKFDIYIRDDEGNFLVASEYFHFTCN